MEELSHNENINQLLQHSNMNMNMNMLSPLTTSEETSQLSPEQDSQKRKTQRNINTYYANEYETPILAKSNNDDNDDGDGDGRHTQDASFYFVGCDKSVSSSREKGSSRQQAPTSAKKQFRSKSDPAQIQISPSLSVSSYEGGGDQQQQGGSSQWSDIPHAESTRHVFTYARHDVDVMSPMSSVYSDTESQCLSQSKSISLSARTPQQPKESSGVGKLETTVSRPASSTKSSSSSPTKTIIIVDQVNDKNNEDNEEDNSANNGKVKQQQDGNNREHGESERGRLAGTRAGGSSGESPDKPDKGRTRRVLSVSSDDDKTQESTSVTATTTATTKINFNKPKTLTPIKDFADDEMLWEKRKYTKFNSFT